MMQLTISSKNINQEKVSGIRKKCWHKKSMKELKNWENRKSWEGLSRILRTFLGGIRRLRGLMLGNIESLVKSIWTPLKNPGNSNSKKSSSRRPKTKSTPTTSISVTIPFVSTEKTICINQKLNPIKPRSRVRPKGTISSKWSHLIDLTSWESNNYEERSR